MVELKPFTKAEWEAIAAKKTPNLPGVIPGAWLEGEMVGYARCMVNKVYPLLDQCIPHHYQIVPGRLDNGSLVWRCSKCKRTVISA